MGAILSSLVAAGRTGPPGHLKQVLRVASHTFRPVSASSAPPVDTSALVAALEPLELSDIRVPLPKDDLSSPCTPDEVRNAAKRPRIRYLSLDERAEYSMGIFFLPRYARIPLHDHIGMHVVSKLLYGTMQVSSYHLLDDPASAQSDGSRVEHVSTAMRTDPREVQALSPSYANVHEILACTDCAMLDVIGPPYQGPERRCQYYKLGDSDTLVPIEEPADFSCRSLSAPAVTRLVEDVLAEIERERAYGGRG